MKFIWLWVYLIKVYLALGVPDEVYVALDVPDEVYLASGVPDEVLFYFI